MNFLCVSIYACFIIFKLARIALERSEEARVLFRSNVCLLDPEMLVFLDESGFVSFQLLFYNFLYSSIICHKSRFFRQLITFFRTKDFLAPIAIVWSVKEPQSNVRRRTGDRA